MSIKKQARPPVPRRIAINGHTYTVTYQDHPLIGGEEHEGFCDYANYRIVLQTGLSVERTRQVLMHEIVHVIEGAYDTILDLNDDTREHKVEIVAQGLLAILTANPKLIDVITSR